MLPQGTRKLVDQATGLVRHDELDGLAGVFVDRLGRVGCRAECQGEDARSDES
jgi:hypothetical protein